MGAPDTADQILDVNRRYHDVVAREYDTKWGIDFDETGRTQVLGKVQKLLGRSPGPYARSLEIGAGTGYFTLNLMQAGVVTDGVCTDISPGMVETLERNAEGLGLDIETAVCDAAELPFEDDSFDLLLGHAVVHHLPDLDRSFAEFARVLRPGGTLLFAGEPSRYGDRIANVPKRVAWKISPLWRRLIGARPLGAEQHTSADHNHDHDHAAEHALEWNVDVHAFTPAELARPARAAGLVDVRVRGEELLASWFGWFNRTLESSAERADIPWGWIRYAYNGYLALQRVDRGLLEPRLPPAIFYNLMVTAQKPQRPPT